MVSGGKGRGAISEEENLVSRGEPVSPAMVIAREGGWHDLYGGWLLLWLDAHRFRGDVWRLLADPVTTLDFNIAPPTLHIPPTWRRY